MPFVTAEELLAASKAGKCDYHNIPDIKAAEAYLAAVLDKALRNAQPNKYDRPWQLVDMGTLLDPKQAWIGFEFETGFDDNADYKKFINFLWGHNHVAIDKEGTGKYPVEVAFPPQVIKDVQKGKSLLVQTLKFIHDNGLKPALNPTTFTKRDVGIHAGISTPLYRKKMAEGRYYDVNLRGYCSILSSLTPKQMDEVYGRHTLHWGTAHARNSYVEIKVFRATPEVEYVEKVAAVACRMAKLLDFCLEHPNTSKLTNAYEFLRGDDAEPVAAN